MDKPCGYENIVSTTLRRLGFPVHPGLCGKCGHAAWRLSADAGGRVDIPYARDKADGEAEKLLFCRCRSLDENIAAMILDCDAYEKAVDETMGVSRGDLPDDFYYFGEKK